MKYHVKHELPDIQDYIDIRIAAGLSRKSIDAATKGLPNTLFSAVVFTDDLPVGFGRVIGDGGCFYEIVDIAILPGHQKQGLGNMIMEEDHGLYS